MRMRNKIRIKGVYRIPERVKVVESDLLGFNQLAGLVYITRVNIIYCLCAVFCDVNRGVLEY